MDCSVCCEKMAKPIECSCGFHCCRTCIRTYLAEQIQDPHCMSCKKVWEPDMLSDVLGKTYTSTTFKKIRAEVYVEFEKNQLAHTQSLVAKFKRDEELLKTIQELTLANKNMKRGTSGCIHCMGGRYKSHWCQTCKLGDSAHNYKASRALVMFGPFMCMGCKIGTLNEGHECRKCAKAHCPECHTIHTGECPKIECICVDYSCDQCRTIQNNEIIQECRRVMRDMEAVKEKHEFLMNCQAKDCKGYLSTKYKCGLCEQYTCSHCLLVKEEGHECKEDDVSTVRLIRKDTKPCPKCSARISKIDGCDQMWCVECKTAFSWKSGNIVNGAIHNPHYYDYLRKTQGFVPRADNPCGDIPPAGTMRLALRTVPDHIRTNLFAFHRFLEEINWMSRRQNPYEEPLVQNRIYYLMNRIDFKKFTQKAFMYYQRSLRFQRISELLTMLREVLLDQLSMMMDVIKKNPGYEGWSKSWGEIQAIFQQTLQTIFYVYDQRKRSPYTSIREEHFRITIESKGSSSRPEEFEIEKWIGTNDLLVFLCR